MNILSDTPPTQLRELPKLAQAAGIARLFAKCENERPFGNFKILGGLRAALNALAAAASVSVEAMLNARPPNLPRLIAASAGNHGLAVALAAQRAGTSATIFLSEHANAIRVRRIERQGATIVRVRGTYDDAVQAAQERAAAGEGILISDTTDTSDDPIVRDVMTGYGCAADEIVTQVKATGVTFDKIFVQAGVGGFAAAMAEGLGPVIAPTSEFYVVEPESAACVAAALEAARLVCIRGTLHTEAEMLSCGLASAPAVEILLRHRARSVTVSEAELRNAVAQLREAGGPSTTPSGATGLAGLLATAMSPTDTALIFITEGELAEITDPVAMT